VPRILRAVEQNDGDALEQFIAASYHDQWEHDPPRVLARLNAVIRYTAGCRSMFAADGAGSGARESR
jgi:hypothetical protein